MENKSPWRSVLRVYSKGWKGISSLWESPWHVRQHVVLWLLVSLLHLWLVRWLLLLKTDWQCLRSDTSLQSKLHPSEVELTKTVLFTDAWNWNYSMTRTIYRCVANVVMLGKAHLGPHVVSFGSCRLQYKKTTGTALNKQKTKNKRHQWWNNMLRTTFLALYYKVFIPQSFCCLSPAGGNVLQKSDDNLYECCAQRSRVDLCVGTNLYFYSNWGMFTVLRCDFSWRTVLSVTEGPVSVLIHFDQRCHLESEATVGLDSLHSTPICRVPALHLEIQVFCSVQELVDLHPFHYLLFVT